jgi:hypothetical protein
MPSVAQVALTADACAGRNFDAIRHLRQWHPEQPDQSDPAGNGFAPLRAPAVGVLHDPFSAPASAQTLRKHPLVYLFKQSSRTLREPRDAWPTCIGLILELAQICRLVPRWGIVSLATFEFIELIRPQFSGFLQWITDRATYLCDLFAQATPWRSARSLRPHLSVSQAAQQEG